MKAFPISSFCPDFDLNPFQMVLSSVKEIQIQEQDRSKYLSDSTACREDGHSFDQPKKPWSLFETAPEVAAVNNRSDKQVAPKIHSQTCPEVLLKLEQGALTHLNQALISAFQQVLRNKGDGVEALRDRSGWTKRDGIG
jgi:hypothetical protein